MEIHRKTVMRALLDSGVFRSPFMRLSDAQVHPQAEILAWATCGNCVRFAAEGFPGEGLVYLQAFPYRNTPRGWSALDTMPLLPGIENVEAQWGLCGRTEFEAAAASGGRHAWLEDYEARLPYAKLEAGKTSALKRKEALKGFTELPELCTRWQGELSGSSKLKGDFELIPVRELDGRPRWLFGFRPEGEATAGLVWSDRKVDKPREVCDKAKMDEGWARHLAIWDSTDAGVPGLHSWLLADADSKRSDRGFLQVMMYCHTSLVENTDAPDGLGREMAGRWMKWIVEAQIDDWEVEHCRDRGHNGNSKAEVFWVGKRNGRETGGMLKIWNADRNGAQDVLKPAAAREKIEWIRNMNETRRKYAEESAKERVVPEPDDDGFVCLADL